jgi:periplasmic copper chaperone A
MRLIQFARLAVAVAAAGVGVLAFAPGAAAHVTVNPRTATQGSYAKITFRVPNEKSDASTVKVEVAFPADRPIASVSVKPVAGWTAQATTTKLPTPVRTGDGEITEAVTGITWTAGADAAVKPGQFQEFDVSVGPLPTVDQIVFKALQTYSDGEIVRWIEEPNGGAEPEHPAPVLKLTPPPAGTGSESARPDTATPDTATPDTAANAAAVLDGRDDGTALGLGIAGLVLGAAGLVIAVLAHLRVGRAARPARPGP